MSSDKIILEKLMKNPKIRNLGLKEEIVSSIVKSYSDIAINVLLDNGYISLDNGMYIEVVKLTDRVHVLRGVPYHSTRKYKLKLTMDESLYDKIEEYYDNLQKEIL